MVELPLRLLEVPLNSETVPGQLGPFVRAPIRTRVSAILFLPSFVRVVPLVRIPVRGQLRSIGPATPTRVSSV